MKEKLKKWQIALIVILAIGAIGGIAGGKDKGEEPKKDEDKVADSKPKEEEKKEEEPKKEEEEKAYTIGDVVTVGDVEYTVNSISSTETIGNEYLNKKAQNMFLVVDITIKNNATKVLMVSDSFFNLENGEKEYKSDSGSAIYLADESIILKEINPDASLTGKVLFDITQETIDSPDTKLQVQTGAWGTEKGLINLH